MISDTLREWLDTNGVTLSEQVKPEEFEDFLINISTGGKLSPEEMLSCLLSLNNIRFQNEIIKEYTDILLKREVIGYSDVALNNVWVIVSVIFYIESDNTKRFSIPRSNICDGSKKFSDLLLEHGILDFNLLNPNQIANLNSKIRFEVISYLLNCVRICTYAGAYKTSTIILSIIEKIYNVTFNIIENPRKHLSYTQVYNLWATSLHKAFKFNEASTVFQLAFEESTKESLGLTTSYHLLLSNLYFTLDLEIYDDCVESINTLREIINQIEFHQENPEELKRKKTDYNIALAYYYEAKNDSMKALEYCLNVYAFYREVISKYDVPPINMSEYLKCLVLLSHLTLKFPELVDDEIKNTLRKVNSETLFTSRLDHRLSLLKILFRTTQISVNEGSISINKSIDEYRKLENEFNLVKNKEYFPLLKNEYYLTGLTLSDKLIIKKEYISSLKNLTAIKDELEIEIKNHNSFINIYLGCLLSIGLNLFHLKKYKNSVAVTKKANYLCNQLFGMNSFEEKNFKFKIFSLLSNCMYELNQFNDSISTFKSAINIANELKSFSSHEFEGSLCVLYATGTKLLKHGLDDSWVLDASEYISERLDSRALTIFQIQYKSYKNQLYTSIFSTFYAFHFQWLDFCIDSSSQYCTRILGLLYSRLIYLKIAERSERPFYASNAINIRDSQKKRHIEYEKYKEQLQVDIINSVFNKDNSNSPFNESDKIFESLRKHAVDENNYVKKIRGSFQTSSRAKDFEFFDVENIASKLEVNECFIALVDGGMIRCLSDHFSGLCRLDDFSHHVLFFEKSGKLNSFKLSLDLDKIIAYVNQSGDIYGKGVLRKGTRKSKINLSDEKSISWENLTKDIYDNFWKPLVSLTSSSVNTFLIVTNGLFHSFPFEAGFPWKEGFHYEQYLSMFFIGKKRPQIMKKKSRNCLNIRNMDDSLLFASYEASPLLEKIWANNSNMTSVMEQTNLTTANQTIGYECLHLSGHGLRDFTTYRFCHEGRLAVSNTEFIDEETVLTKFSGIEYVWLSSCAMGISEEDTDGDPTGLVTPFLLAGSKKVIASVTNVPDIWMPLLVSLTEWIYVRTDLSIDKALREAKYSLFTIGTSSLYSDYLTIYKKWVKDILISWFQDMWDVTDGEPWLEVNRSLFKQFLHQLLTEDLPDVGFVLGKYESEQLIDSAHLSNFQIMNIIIDKFTFFACNPPLEVCETLKCTVIVFSGNFEDNLFTN